MKAIYTPEERKRRRYESYKRWRDKSGYDWRKLNPEKAKASRLSNYAKNKDAIRAKQIAWIELNPESAALSQKKWRDKNPDYMPTYYKDHKDDYTASRKKRAAIPEKRAKYLATATRLKKIRIKTDLNYRIKETLRCRLKMALRNNKKGKAKKSYKTMEMLGCSIESFKMYIESLWETGMTWDNHGKGSDKWNIDHIIACALFDLTLPQHQKAYFHFSNLQPLWEPANLKKGIKLPIPQTEQQPQPNILGAIGT